MLITNTGCGMGYFLLVLLFSSLPVISTHCFKKEKRRKSQAVLKYSAYCPILSWVILYIYCKLIINYLGKFTSESNYSNWFNENSCSPVLCSERMKSPSAEFSSWLVWIFKFDKKNAPFWVASKSEVSNMEMMKKTSTLLTLNVLLGTLSALFNDFFNSLYSDTFYPRLQQYFEG